MVPQTQRMKGGGVDKQGGAAEGCVPASGIIKRGRMLDMFGPRLVPPRLGGHGVPSLWVWDGARTKARYAGAPKAGKLPRRDHAGSTAACFDGARSLACGRHLPTTKTARLNRPVFVSIPATDCPTLCLLPSPTTLLTVPCPAPLCPRQPHTLNQTTCFVQSNHNRPPAATVCQVLRRRDAPPDAHPDERHGPVPPHAARQGARVHLPGGHGGGARPLPQRRALSHVLPAAAAAGEGRGA